MSLPGAGRGPVWARLTSGEILGTALSSPRVTAAATPGQVPLTFAVPPWRVRARVGTGSLTVMVPPGDRYRVTGRSGTGIRSIEPNLANPASPRLISAGRGSVSVSAPPLAAPGAPSP